MKREFALISRNVRDGMRLAKRARLHVAVDQILKKNFALQEMLSNVVTIP